MSDLIPEPCTTAANEQGCSCTIPTAGPTDIDPPEPRIDRHCPLHGKPEREYDHEEMLERRAWREETDGNGRENR